MDEDVAAVIAAVASGGRASGQVAPSCPELQKMKMRYNPAWRLEKQKMMKKKKKKKRAQYFEADLNN